MSITNSKYITMAPFLSFSTEAICGVSDMCKITGVFLGCFSAIKITACGECVTGFPPNEIVIEENKKMEVGFSSTASLVPLALASVGAALYMVGVNINACLGGHSQSGVSHSDIIEQQDPDGFVLLNVADE